MTFDAGYEAAETPVREPRPCGLLPREVERRLILASQLPVERDRMRAIDEAVALGMRLYPERWRREARVTRR